MTRQSIGGQELDLLTAGELGAQLHQHMGDKFLSDLQTERLRGLKLMRLPVVKVVATASSFTLAAPVGSAPCGPESGYVWMVPRLLIASSALVVTGGAATQAGPGAGVGTPGAGAQIISLGTLPAGTYTVQWTTIITGATGNTANNFAVKVGATQVAASVNTTAIGNTLQQSTTVSVPAGGAAVTINAIAADAAVGVVYNAQATASPIITGDTAVISGLYVASDTTPQQQALVDASLKLNQGYYTGTKGLFIKSGEQLFATLTGATVGNIYTISGQAIEAPTIMQGKLI